MNQPELIEPKAEVKSGRPSGGYRNKAGTRVPGVTTIIGRFKESGGLLHWAWECGMNGLDINKVRDDAADAGTCCHEMIDCHIHGRTFKHAPWDSMIIQKAEHAMLGYLEWSEQTKLKLVASEQSLVSEKYNFGGTFDCVLTNGQLRLLDYKTSSGIYQDYLIQVAGGYSLLWQEHYPDKPLQGMDLLRISKPKSPDDPVSFEHRHWSAEIFAPCQRQFILFREAYELDKKLKGLL